MSPNGSTNVAAGAIDMDDLAAMQEAGFIDDDSQVAPDGDFGAPEDFDPDAVQVPEIIKEARAKRTPKPKQTKTQLAAAQRVKAKAKADAEKKREAARAERAAAKAKRDEERAAAKEAKKAAREAGPDLTGLISDKPIGKAKFANLPVDALDGIDGGDPVDKSFVDAVKNAGGILQSIRVRSYEAPDGETRYNIIDGKRRAQAARALELPTIPALIETREGANDFIDGLMANFQRSNNVIEEHRMVTALVEAGYTLRQIAKATGMKQSQISRAANVGRLLPELQDAVEAGQMASYAAREISMLPENVQRELVRKLEANGKITAADANEAKKYKQAGAVKKLVDEATADGENLFDVPEVSGDGETAPAKEMTRTQKVAAAVMATQRALDLISGLSARSADEDDAVTFLTQVLTNLTTPAS